MKWWSIASLLVLAVATGCGDDDDAASDGGAVSDGGPSVDGSPAILLSQTGLYSDIASKTIAPGNLEYVPAYKLYSDGAEKRRWLSLPPGGKIDSANMDRWKFPVGTRFYKEFKLAGRLIETRVIEKISADEWTFTPYLWRDSQSEADALPAGLQDVPGTNGYDIPSSARCLDCHRGDPDKVLGFQAIQLSKEPSAADPVALKADVVRNLLTAPPPAGVDYPVPGNAIEAKALGQLHANCGHCHNPSSPVFGQVNHELRLSVAERVVDQTSTYRTTVGQLLTGWKVGQDGYTYRIEAGNHLMSGIWFRTSVRGNNDQMPPRRLTTDLIDTETRDAVAAWIDSLP